MGKKKTSKSRPDPKSEFNVLLRFRDLTADTVSEHRKTIRQHGACWWGWWRRPNEEQREEVWDFLREQISRHDEVYIGLFHSGEEDDVRVARVVEVIPPADVSQPPAAPKGSEELVPEYYRSSPFSSAWLRMDFIASKAVDFFGAYSLAVAPPLPNIPEELLWPLKNKVIIDSDELRQMDTTIWQVRRRKRNDSEDRFLAPGTRLIRPISSQPIHLRGSRILHLTDIHFGDDKFRKQHAWGYPGETSRRLTMVDAIARAIRSKELDIGLVVVSGDFTFAGLESEFKKAANAIHSLMGSLQIDTDRLVIVPGNHDIKWTKDSEEAYDPEIGVTNAPEAAKKAYKAFYQQLLGHAPNDKLSMGRRFVLPCGMVVDVCGLNSSSLETNRKYLPGIGRVEPGSFGGVADKLGWRDFADSMALRLLVIHHHLTPTEDMESPAEYAKGLGMAIDAKQVLRQAARKHVQLVLHGHRHRVFLWREGVYALPEYAEEHWRLGDVLLLGGGSAGSSSVIDDSHYFNVIEIENTGIQVDIFRSKKFGDFRPIQTFLAEFALKDGALRVGDWSVKKKN